MVNDSAFLIKFEYYPTLSVRPQFNIQAATQCEPDTCDFMESLENNHQKAFLKFTEKCHSSQDDKMES